ncbi:MAG TPA: hypothetical protein VEM94_03925 [Candidatus Dormibacteraeota bacterium]|nr:hypothetical protein [Candidatus Dormibacteraeota bacterium]
MSFPLWDLAQDLAIARGGNGPDAKADTRFLKGRIAGVLWVPGAAGSIFLGVLSGSYLVGLLAFVAVVLGLATFVIGPRTIATFVRRRFAKQA